MPQSVKSATSSERPQVVIAGASGFIGKSLVAALAPTCDIVALSRHAMPATNSFGDKPKEGKPSIIWRQCDLFSTIETEKSLAGCDIAIYLVHSMMPSARLAQGRFEDFDLVIADNFGRAARSCGIRRIIYLGGIIPSGELSRHLASRLEVEKVLAEFGVPVIALRAGMVIGRNGSSFEIMRKLVQRLPLMVCPKWTSTKSRPIAVEDVIAAMDKVVNDPHLAAGSYDLGGSETVTYLEMMKTLARMLGKRRIMIPVFIFSPRLSCLWVRLVARAPRELVTPLVESLRHEMVPRDQYILDRYEITPSSFYSAMAQSIAVGKRPAVAPDTKAGADAVANGNTVFSFQRMPLPPGKSATWVAEQYANWIIEFFRPLLRVERTQGGLLTIKFRFLFSFFEFVLIQLAYEPKKSTPHSCVYLITGGVLVSKTAPKIGIFEFREVLCGKSLIVAISDYSPALPWWLYKKTQAFVHLRVMNAFRRHLMRNAKSQIITA